MLKNILQTPFTSVVSYFFLQRVIKHAISNEETKTVSKKDREAFYLLPQAKPFHLMTEDKELLEAIIVPGILKKAVLICSGGLESYELHSFPIAKAYLDVGFHVLVFNYRGFGNSTGKPTAEGLCKDAEAAYQFLVKEKGFNKDSIIGHGYSLGGGVISEIAVRHGFKIIIDRSFTRFSDVVYNYMKKKNFAFITRVFAKWIIKICFQLDTLSKLKKIRNKVLIFRGLSDLSMSDKDILALHNLIKNHRDPSLFTVVEAPVGHFHGIEPIWLEGKNFTKKAREAWLKFI